MVQYTPSFSARCTRIPSAPRNRFEDCRQGRLKNANIDGLFPVPYPLAVGAATENPLKLVGGIKESDSDELPYLASRRSDNVHDSHSKSRVILSNKTHVQLTRGSPNSVSDSVVFTRYLRARQLSGSRNVATMLSGKSVLE